jgi:hypothetical protein
MWHSDDTYYHLTPDGWVEAYKRPADALESWAVSLRQPSEWAPPDQFWIPTWVKHGVDPEVLLALHRRFPQPGSDTEPAITALQEAVAELERTCATVELPKSAWRVTKNLQNAIRQCVADAGYTITGETCHWERRSWFFRLSTGQVVMVSVEDSIRPGAIKIVATETNKAAPVHRLRQSFRRLPIAEFSIFYNARDLVSGSLAPSNPGPPWALTQPVKAAIRRRIKAAGHHIKSETPSYVDAAWTIDLTIGQKIVVADHGYYAEGDLYITVFGTDPDELHQLLNVFGPAAVAMTSRVSGPQTTCEAPEHTTTPRRPLVRLPIPKVWSPTDFGKFYGQGKTLPQIALSDPDWFFHMYEHDAFLGGLAGEAEEVAKKASQIRIPGKSPRDFKVQYYLSEYTGRFWYIEIAPADEPDPIERPFERLDFLDLSLPRRLQQHDKRGGRRIIKQLKIYVFDNAGMRFTKAASERFFNEASNFGYRDSERS